MFLHWLDGLPYTTGATSGAGLHWLDGLPLGSTGPAGGGQSHSLMLGGLS